MLFLATHGHNIIYGGCRKTYFDEYNGLKSVVQKNAKTMI